MYNVLQYMLRSLGDLELKSTNDVEMMHSTLIMSYELIGSV